VTETDETIRIDLPEIGLHEMIIMEYE